MKYPLQGLLKRTWHVWRYRMTGAGKLILIAMWLSGTAGAAMLTVPIHHLFWALASVAFFASLGGLVLRPRVRLTGPMPERATAGQTLEAVIDIHNTSRLPTFDVGLGLFGLPDGVALAALPATLPVLHPGESASQSIRLCPKRRGLYPMPDLEAFTSFAFNFYRRPGTTRRTPPLLVLPSFQPLASIDLPAARRYQPGGVALTSNIGESPEYIGNRDYRPGDPTRRIDFRSWGRLARPVVREFQEEYFSRVALVLDTFVAPGRRRPTEGYPDLEAAVSLCAAVADALTRGEYVIDIFAAGPELYVFRAGRNVLHFDSVLEILACVDACRHSPFGTIAPALEEELQSISTVVYVLLDWDDARERFVREAVESACQSKVIVVRDGPTTKPIEAAEDWTGPIQFLPPRTVLDGGVNEL